MGPEIGVDVGVIKTHGRYVVASSDPITGADRRIGWYAVNVSANDVATSGIMPSTLTVVTLLPSSSSTSQILALMTEIYRTAKSLGISVAGGHTEITPGLSKPLVVVTAFGTGEKYVTAAMGENGDSILMTKTAGIEGTSIISTLPGARRTISRNILMRGESLIGKLSIVPEAKEAFATGRVHAMHDATEGGILGAVLEMSIASNLGFEMDAESIPIDESTRVICDEMMVDPLKLLGSGSLLICCSNEDESKIMERLSNQKTKCTKIGRLVSKRRGRTITSNNKRTRVVKDFVQDELWSILRKYRLSSLFLCPYASIVTFLDAHAFMKLK